MMDKSLKIGVSLVICFATVVSINGQEVLTNPSGAITYPTSGNYPGKTQKNWLVNLSTLPDVDYISFIFSRIGFENCSPGCTCDYVAIYQGSNAATTPVVKLCNESATNVGPFIISGPLAYIRFYSDPMVESTGFQVSYETFYKPTTTTTTESTTTTTTTSTTTTTTTPTVSTTMATEAPSTQSTTTSTTSSTASEPLTTTSVMPDATTSESQFSETTNVPITSTTSATVIPSQAVMEMLGQKGVQGLIPTLPSQPKYTDTTANVLQRCDHFDRDSAAPPSHIPNEPLPIGAAFQVRSLAWISNVEETIQTSAVMLLSWKVSTCPANSSTALSPRMTEEILADADKIWLPKLRFTSASDSNVYMQDVAIGDDFVAVMGSPPGSPNKTFSFYWTREGAFSAVCSLNLLNFPFDEQVCNYRFSLIRSAELVAFHPDQVFFVFPKSSVEKTEWILSGTKTTISTDLMGGHNVSAVTFSVQLTRIPSFYLRNLVMPNAVLGLLEIAVFLIPPNLPDRPMFSVTIVLALTVSQSEVMNHVPKKPDNTLLGMYIQSMAWFAAACTVYQLFTVWLTNSIFGKKSHRKEPRFFSKRFSFARMLDIIALALAILFYIVLSASFLKIEHFKKLY